MQHSKTCNAEFNGVCNLVFSFFRGTLLCVANNEWDKISKLCCMFPLMLISLLSGWVWQDRGFLYQLHVVDIAGCAAVHLVGGASALVAAIMLKPRTGRYDEGRTPNLKLGSPTNALVGMFMLW